MILLVDQLYSRQIFDNHPYTHLRALPERPENMLTIMGPSKTESLSGFRLGVAYGSAPIITRMEKLQAIVSLRAAGYCQSAYLNWVSEPQGWLEARVADQKTALESYQPDEVSKLDKAILTQSGNTVVLVVAADADKAQSTLDGLSK